MRRRTVDVGAAVIDERLDQAKPVTLYENPDFTGRSTQLNVGEHRFYTPDDFNDAAASIQVAPGHVAWIFEHADEGGGYGISVDLMEDCSDLSMYGMDKLVSFVSVFSATNQTGHIWVRGSGSGPSYVPGHWAALRASGQSPNGETGAVSPPIPSQLPHPQVTTTVQVSGPAFDIVTLGQQDPEEASRWEAAVDNQFGVVGTDFRGPEPIGSACFQRDPRNFWLNAAQADRINWWYPQRQPRDHRPDPYFKRTCIGIADHADIANYQTTYRDVDLDIYIKPDERHMYLIREAHPREYTDIMEAQWKAHQGGHPNCDHEVDPSGEEFKYVEAEIQPSMDLASGVVEGLRDRIRGIPDKQIGVYGPWIYDRGHCCHPEIHPAEQIWWREATGSATTYYLNVFCDASGRFWWRYQMDGDDKRKPWAAPPITGVFAIAFEVAMPGEPNVVAPLEFAVSDISRHNAEPKSDGGERLLNYEGNTLVRFIPNSDGFAASFEEVGLADNGHIRGFLVLEVTVGQLSQTRIDSEFPRGVDVNSLDQGDEGKVFEKEEGHYMFTVTTRKDDSLPVK